MTRSFELSFAAVDILCTALRVNCRQFPFEVPSTGMYLADRARIAVAVFDDLERRGLARGGDLQPVPERALRLLGEHKFSIAVLGHVNGGPEIRARAAAAAKEGVVVTQQDGGLRFDVVRRDALVANVVRLLPAANAGPGRSVTFTQPAKVEPVESSFRKVVRAPRTIADTERRAAEEILRRPRLSTGYLVVARQDELVPGLTWVHTDAGRYLAQSVTNDQGDVHVSYFPVDDARLAHVLTTLTS